MTEVDRREFLKTVAAAGTGLAVSRLSRAGARDNNVVIVGAGLAGLAAAYKLKLKGRPYRIIEKTPGLGGICWSETYEGFRFPTGTACVTTPWRRSAAATIYGKLPRKWYRAIPAPYEGVVSRGAVVGGSSVFRSWWQIPGITKAQSDDCQALSDWFVARYNALDWPIHRNLANDLRRYEDVTVRQMIQTFRPGCDRWVLEALDSFVCRSFNANMDEVGGLQGIDMIGAAFGGGTGGKVVGRTTHCVADLVDALSVQLSSDSFLCNTYVTGVRNAGSQVELTCVTGGQTATLTCAACVVATDALTARTIVQDLPEKVASALGSIRYGQYAVVNLIMAQDTLPIGAFGCSLGEGVISDIYDFTFVQKRRTGVPLESPPGIYGCYVPARGVADHTPVLPEPELVALCLDELDSVFGAGTRDKVTETRVRQYSHGMPVFSPGTTRMQESWLIPAVNERIVLAGDFVQGSPTVEGALEAGWAAGKAAARLTA